MAPEVYSNENMKMLQSYFWFGYYFYFAGGAAVGQGVVPDK